MIKNIGRFVIKEYQVATSTLAFTLSCIKAIFNPKSYNSAMRLILYRQIYFTNIQPLPTFILSSMFFGSLLLVLIFTVTKDLGLTDMLGDIVIDIILYEFSPLFTVFLISLRSSSAINTEIAVMQVNREIDTLKSFDIDIISYLFLPRILNGVITILALSSIFSISVLSSGYILSYLFLDFDFSMYSIFIAKAVDFNYLIVLFVKCVAFGFFITLIPIIYGMKASHELTTIPIAVLHGMIMIFRFIIIIEVLSLIIRFI